MSKRNHPNRSQRALTAAYEPTPDEIRAAREAAGLTQAQAAEMLGRPERWWAALEMEKGSSEWRPLNPALWAFFRLLTLPQAEALELLEGLRGSVRGKL